jgi:hypothetical protein
MSRWKGKYVIIVLVDVQKCILYTEHLSLLMQSLR